jgi:hypothetical protein
MMKKSKFRMMKMMRMMRMMRMALSFSMMRISCVGGHSDRDDDDSWLTFMVCMGLEDSSFLS